MLGKRFKSHFTCITLNFTQLVIGFLIQGSPANNNKKPEDGTYESRGLVSVDCDLNLKIYDCRLVRNRSAFVF